MMIDTHMFVGLQNISKDNLIDFLDRNEIDKCWLMTWEEYLPGDWVYYHLSPEDVLDLYKKHPDRIIPMYAPDPNEDNSLEKFIKYHDLGFQGFGELKSTCGWDHPNLLKILEYLDKNKLYLTFHMEEPQLRFIHCSKSNIIQKILIKLFNESKFFNRKNKGFIVRKILKYIQYEFPGYMMNFEGLINVLNKFPNIKFVGHGPYFWKNISSIKDNNFHPKGKIDKPGIICELLEKYDNLFCDTSGKSGFNAFSRDRDFSIKFIKKFQDKIIYGTDNFQLNQRELFYSFDLETEIYEKLFFLNAEKIIGNK